MAGARSFVVPQLLDALKDLDLDVAALVSASDAASLGAPDGVRVVSDVALAAALADADVVVHHGGAGCVMTSVAAGIPQVAVTFAGEQVANADRIAAAGAGLHIPGHDVTPDAIRSAVSAVASERRFADAAHVLKAQNDARPAPAALIGNLEELAAVRAPAH